jgi:4-amino-4-deoxy-L-arabinose transferase-like glycosyltransferase
MNRIGRFALLLILFALFAVLYLANIDGWLMHDDEGTDFYEVWQLQAGQRPGEDYIAEQQPLYLIIGSTLITAFDRSPLPLRLLVAVQLLLGALFLSLIVFRLWGGTVAALALALTLSSGLVYEQARLFRPDPMMLAWEMLGLAALLMAVAQGHKKWWLLAGLSYGTAVLWKPFGVFPIVGLGFYFLHWLWRQPGSWPTIFRDGLLFAGTFLLVSAGVSFVLYSQLGFYYLEPFEQHASLGQGTNLMNQITRTGWGYFAFLFVNSVFVFFVPLWFLNRPPQWHNQPKVRLLLWQLVTPIIFVAISRPLFIRYLLYLVPVFAILLACHLELAFRKISRQEQPPLKVILPAVTFTLLFAFLTTQPRIVELLLRKESGTLALADYVAAHTQPDDKVLSDYAGINFFANRTSIYEASIIAGSQIAGEIVTGELLTRRIEENHVQMVLIHIKGGDPPAHQLVELVDYDTFRAYIEQHFELLTIFDRAGQQIEIFQRKETASP